MKHLNDSTKGVFFFFFFFFEGGEEILESMYV